MSRMLVLPLKLYNVVFHFAYPVLSFSLKARIKRTHSSRVIIMDAWQRLWCGFVSPKFTHAVEFLTHMFYEKKFYLSSF